MKLSFALVVAALLACASAMPTAPKLVSATTGVQPTQPELNQCPLCVEYAGVALNVLLNEILNKGIVQTCGTVCGELSNRTSHDIGFICNLVCDYEGIKEFIKAIEKADLDPFYYCQLLDKCPTFDYGDATIVSFTVTPPSGPYGTVFTIEMDYESKNGTGPGEIDMAIKTVDHVQVGENHYMDMSKPGKYGIKYTVKAERDPHCNPIQGPCEDWLSGEYPVELAICEGECGSHHPHSSTYDQGTTSFTIT